MNLPPDRSHISTEKSNPECNNLHQLDAAQVIQEIQRQDHFVIRALEEAQAQLISLCDKAEKGFKKEGRLIYFGAGTSGRLGVLDASEAPPTFHVSPSKVIGIIAGGDGSLRKSSEAKEDVDSGAIDELKTLNLNADDTLIGIAAGGTTPYVHGGLKWAKTLEHPPLTALITCSGGIKGPYIDEMIYLNTGPEVLTGSTRMKAGSATKMALNTISTTLMIRSGRVYGNLMIDVKATNDKLKDRASRIIMQITHLDRESSFQLLDQADGKVKTALVMHHLKVTKEEAESKILCAGQDISQLIESHESPE
ncbi:MAG: N-acetylmuramic acid 6-phosphate etherase [Planctomycetes bacterium]|nr:N-acetylmuramic acid 6-phosphate etherase [Planctomycetota bacterium]